MQVLILFFGFFSIVDSQLRPRGILNLPGLSNQDIDDTETEIEASSPADNG